MITLNKCFPNYYIQIIPFWLLLFLDQELFLSGFFPSVNLGWGVVRVCLAPHTIISQVFFSLILLSIQVDWEWVCWGCLAPIWIISCGGFFHFLLLWFFSPFRSLPCLPLGWSLCFLELFDFFLMFLFLSFFFHQPSFPGQFVFLYYFSWNTILNVLIFAIQKSIWGQQYGNCFPYLSCYGVSVGFEDLDFELWWIVQLWMCLHPMLDDMGFLGEWFAVSHVLFHSFSQGSNGFSLLLTYPG